MDDQVLSQLDSLLQNIIQPPQYERQVKIQNHPVPDKLQDLYDLNLEQQKKCKYGSTIDSYLFSIKPFNCANKDYKHWVVRILDHALNIMMANIEQDVLVELEFNHSSAGVCRFPTLKRKELTAEKFLQILEDTDWDGEDWTYGVDWSDEGWFYLQYTSSHGTKLADRQTGGLSEHSNSEQEDAKQTEMQHVDFDDSAPVTESAETNDVSCLGSAGTQQCVGLEAKGFYCFSCAGKRLAVGLERGDISRDYFKMLFCHDCNSELDVITKA